MKPGPPSVPEILRRLEGVYDCPDLRGRFNPLEELVACILSQHTSDANSLGAYADLRRTFPEWEALAAAPVEMVAAAIRRGGLANQKARTIRACLKSIHGSNGGYHLDNLCSMPPAEAAAWLRRLPGVGPKTAAIVVCFALGGEVCPVDTHVHRVARRLGLVGRKTNADRAHDELGCRIPKGMAYRLHAALIAHGRSVCLARAPRCSGCVLAPLCPSTATLSEEERRRSVGRRCAIMVEDAARSGNGVD